MDYGKNTIGWLVWWKLPPRISVGALNKALARTDISLKLSLVDPLSKRSLETSIRKIIPDVRVRLVAATDRYRRYQVVREVRSAGTVKLDTVEFVRILSNGRIICELRKEYEKALADNMGSSKKWVLSSSLDAAIGRYMTSVLGAVYIDGVYFVPCRGYGELVPLSRLLKRIDVVLRMFKIPAGSGVLNSVCAIVSKALVKELDAVLHKALKTGKHKAGVRAKHAIKRTAANWENTLQMPLYIFRWHLARIAIEYPELQDIDEMK